MPVTDVRRLAAACALVRVDATVVPLEGAGAAVVLRDPDAADAAAERLSRVLGQGELTAFERREDMVEAATWRGGTRVARPPAGAALACLPDSAERLVLGAEPSTFPDTVETRGMSRAAAARTAMAGSPAEAAWVARLERWRRVAGRVVLALLLAVVAWQVVLTARGGGSAVVLGVAIALAGLLGVQALRRRGRS